MIFLISDKKDIIMALLDAVRQNNYSTVERLLCAGEPTDDGAFIYASTRGYTDIVRILLKYGADVGADYDSAILFASSNGHLETVQLLLQHGANAHVYNGYAL